MSFWKRVFYSIGSKSKHRLPEQMALLGAPQQRIDEVSLLAEEQQEAAFLAFAKGSHACVLDWKADRDDVFDELVPLLSTEELRLLPEPDQCPGDAAGAIDTIRRAISTTGRTLLQTESTGDFTILILVPTDKAQAYARIVGPWLVGN